MGLGLADPEKLATVGRERGHQVPIKHNDSEYGLYTVSQVRQERPDKTKLATKSTAGCRPCPIRQNGSQKPRGTKNAPANSRPAYERAALVARQLLQGRHCFAPPAAEAETAIKATNASPVK